jgi:hypothetical protein
MSLIETTQEEFYNDVIQSRLGFAEQVSEYKATLDTLVEDITGYSANYYTNTVTWLGGSRSWYETLNVFFPGFIWDKITMSAIVPGNYDMFFLCNTPKFMNSMICDIHDKVSNTINKLQLLHNVSVTVQRKNFTIRPECNIKYSKDYCALFPCSSISVYISEKLLFYIEFSLIGNLNTVQFRDLLLRQSDSGNRVYYWNMTGLLFSLEYIKVSRKEKVMNIDRLRSGILDKLEQYTPSNYELSKVYYTLFSQTNYYDDKFRNDMVFKSVDKVFFKGKLEGNIQVYIMAKLRPMINMFIKHVSDILHAKFQDDAFIFIVGGDAIRRYDYNITETKDIDTKLYYKKKSKFNTIKNMIVSELCHFVVFIAIKYTEILQDTEYSSGVFIKLVSDTDKSPYYLRMIRSGKDFPVDLFSLDYKYTIKIRVEDIDYTVKQTLPILDIVLQQSSKEKSDVSTVIGDLNVSSLNFLISDIINTYNNRELAQGRFWNDKNNQDKARLKMLRQKVLTGMDVDANDELSVKSDTVMGNDPEVSKLGEEYHELFKRYMRKTPGLAKYKLKFGFDIDEEDTVYIKSDKMKSDNT